MIRVCEYEARKINSKPNTNLDNNNLHNMQSGALFFFSKSQWKWEDLEKRAADSRQQDYLHFIYFILL